MSIKEIKNVSQIKNAPQSVRYRFYLEMYNEYRNEFLTVSSFAEHYSIDDKTAMLIIDIGKIINDKNLYEYR